MKEEGNEVIINSGIRAYPRRRKRAKEEGRGGGGGKGRRKTSRGKECSVDEGGNEGKHRRGGKENRRYDGREGESRVKR